MSDAVYELHRGDHEELGVHALRDQYGADLVQLVGFYLNSCGIGWVFGAPDTDYCPPCCRFTVPRLWARGCLAQP